MSDDKMIHISTYSGNDKNNGLTRVDAVASYAAAFDIHASTIEDGDTPRIALETRSGEWEYA